MLSSPRFSRAHSLSSLSARWIASGCTNGRAYCAPATSIRHASSAKSISARRMGFVTHGLMSMQTFPASAGMGYVANYSCRAHLPSAVHHVFLHSIYFQSLPQDLPRCNSPSHVSSLSTLLHPHCIIQPNTACPIHAPYMPHAPFLSLGTPKLQPYIHPTPISIPSATTRPLLPPRIPSRKVRNPLVTEGYQNSGAPGVQCTYDYIMTHMDSALTPTSATLALDAAPWLSDHCGVVR